MTYTWFRAITSQVVVTAPGWLGTVIVVPNSGSKRTSITLYDGESATDPQIVTIRSPSGVTHPVNFRPPLKTHRGLYVKFGSNVEEVLIQFQWKAE